MMMTTTTIKSVQCKGERASLSHSMGLGKHKVRDRIHRVKLYLMLCAHIIYRT